MTFQAFSGDDIHEGCEPEAVAIKDWQDLATALLNQVERFARAVCPNDPQRIDTDPAETGKQIFRFLGHVGELAGIAVEMVLDGIPEERSGRAATAPAEAQCSVEIAQTAKGPSVKVKAYAVTVEQAGDAALDEYRRLQSLIEVGGAAPVVPPGPSEE